MITRAKKFIFKDTTADIVAVVAFLNYFLLLLFFAHTSRPMMDEGLYTYKGWLFVSGRYTPYQDYGPWMNHMPFSFLIPGVIQVLFGPGLRAGRYFAIFLAMLMLVGLYLISRRFGGRWVATGVVLVLLLNFSVIKTYSIALSQGLVSCMIVWILYFSLGEGRPQWQLMLAVFLSAVLVLTRINMFPVFLLLVLYILWENGWTKVRWTILVAVISFFGLHAMFGRAIFDYWGKWISSFFNPLLDFSFDSISDSPDSVDVSPNRVIAKVSSFFITVRIHFIAIIGTVSTWLLWPHRNQWKKQSHFRAAVFLSITFGIMFLAHAMVTLGKNYCVFCFSIYTSFFYVLGILLVAISWPAWKRKVSITNLVLILLLIVITFTGIAYSWSDRVNFDSAHLIQKIFSLSSKALSSPTDFKEVALNFILNLFGVQNEQDVRALSKRMNAAYYGLLGALFFLAVTVTIWYVQKRTASKTIPLSNFLLSTFLVAGFLVLRITTMVLNAGAFHCREDQIRNFEDLGEEISSIIPDNSQIYWAGYSPSLLLYLPDVQIYPPQLNGTNSYKNSKDTDELYRKGFWNRELNKRWANEASYMILIQEAYAKDKRIKRFVKSGLYREVHLNTSSFYTCDDTNQLTIHLLERVD